MSRLFQIATRALTKLGVPILDEASLRALLGN